MTNNREVKDSLKINEESHTTTFTKQQLLNSQKYKNRQDALNALLKEGETYTIAQVEKILNQFYKGGKQ